MRFAKTFTAAVVAAVLIAVCGCKATDADCDHGEDRECEDCHLQKSGSAFPEINHWWK